jgi:hypothetical protein
VFWDEQAGSFRRKKGIKGVVRVEGTVPVRLGRYVRCVEDGSEDSWRYHWGKVFVNGPKVDAKIIGLCNARVDSSPHSLKKGFQLRRRLSYPICIRFCEQPSGGSQHLCLLVIQVLNFLQKLCMLVGQ